MKNFTLGLAALCCAGFGMWPMPAASGGREIMFKHIGTEQGLSHVKVPSIAEDSLGYMWFATSDGLDSYNGYEFKVYRHDPGNGRSIGGNVIKHIATDQCGRLWVGTDKGLSLYDRHIDSFENFEPSPNADNAVTAIIAVSSDRLVVGTSDRLYNFSIAQRQFSPWTLPIKIDKPTDFDTANGMLYVGTSEAGAYQIATDGNDMVKLPVGQHINAIVYDKKERLYVGCEGEGLYVYNLRTSKVENYRKGGAEGLNSDFVRSMAFDSSGRLWVGTFVGICIFDPTTNQFVASKTASHQPGSLSHSSVRSIYADRQGGMWLGTYFGGINYYHPLQQQFKHLQFEPGRQSLNDNVISCIVEAHDGLMYIGTNNGGMNIYNRATGAFAHITAADGLGSDDVKSIYVDHQQRRIYIGSNLGELTVVDAASHRVVKSYHGISDVYDILPGKSGRLWICTLHGVGLLNPENGDYKLMTTDIEGIPFNQTSTTDLFRDREGRLWISGENGIAVYDEQGESLKRLPLLDAYPKLLSAHVNNVFQSAAGNIYISTDEGIYMFKAKTLEMTHITKADGLSNDLVYGMLEDAAGKLWISTNLGLTAVDPATMSFRYYTAADGLQSNQFNYKSFCKTADGRMWFGGVNGISTFDPAAIKPNPFAPAPIITNLYVFNEKVAPGDDTGILDTDIRETKRITLSPEQSMITIDFAVSNFIAGSNNTFAYMLEGFDTNWHKASNVRSVTYFNLPAGKYRFVVNAANNDGLWNASPTALEINVRPHWYRTWWAIVLFTLLIATIAYITFRHMLSNKAMAQQLEFERCDKMRQHELDDMMVRFFVNMSHELKTPLTLILLPVNQLLAQHNDNPKTAAKLRTIRDNANRMLSLINQMLNYRRAELGMVKLRVAPVAIKKLCHSVFAFFEHEASRKMIDYRMESDFSDKETVLCDQNSLTSILNNLLSNAFKYTPFGGKITVTVGRDKAAGSNRLILKVIDTGCGISPENLDKIFVRFYQVNGTNGGSGIGLAYVKCLVELHHGTIDVASTLGEGSTFSVALPIDPASYADEELADDDGNDGNDTTPTRYPYDSDLPALAEDYENEPAEPVDGAHAANSETILIVDDNPTMLQYLNEALSPLYNVVTAKTAAAAIEKLTTEHVDLIITDVMMPDMDGIQFCKSVKLNVRTSHIPVFMLSAKSDVNQQLEGFNVGADDYLPKPFPMSLLLTKIRNCFRTRFMMQTYASPSERKPEKMALNPLDEDFLKKAVNIVDKHLDNDAFTTDEFAREMCMSRSNLHLKMKSITGETTNEFIRSRRLNHAMTLLKEGRYTVSEVASKVGYSTPSYFSTSFKKFFGALPSEFLGQNNAAGATTEK